MGRVRGVAWENLAMRDFLLEHINAPNGRLPIERRPRSRLGHVRTALVLTAIHRGYIREGDRYERNPRPKYTYITDAGRFALAKALALWAEKLTAQEARIEQMREFAELATIGEDLVTLLADEPAE